MEKLIEFLKELIKRRFYGRILLRFEAGNVVVIEKITETIKL